VPLIGVIAWGWDAFVLLMLYWRATATAFDLPVGGSPAASVIGRPRFSCGGKSPLTLGDTSGRSNRGLTQSAAASARTDGVGALVWTPLAGNR